MIDVRQEFDRLSDVTKETRPVIISAPKYERRRGCFNCLGFDNGPRAVAAFADSLTNDLKMLHQEHPPDVAKAHFVRQLKVARAFAPPNGGICRWGKAEAKFVHHAYFCSSWRSRIRPETPMEKPPEELRDDLGYAPIKPPRS